MLYQRVFIGTDNLLIIAVLMAKKKETKQLN